MSGEVSILNITTGDTKISFDPTNPKETERTKTIITDMLHNGYIISVVVDGQMKRVKKFDPNTNEYIIGDLKKRRGPRKLTRVKAETTSAVAVGRTAGGALGVRTFGYTAQELQKARNDHH